MGGACSAPYLDSLDPPLEILVLSDSTVPDATLITFLTDHSWLSSSTILHHRLVPRLLTEKPLSTITVYAPSSHHRHSTISHLPHSPSSPSIPHTHHAPSHRSSLTKPLRASSSATVLPSSPSPPSPLALSVFPPSRLPLISFITSSHPFTLRFHTCPNYHSLLHPPNPKPHSSHIRRASRPSLLPPPPPPLRVGGRLDGCVVFVGVGDAVGAGGVVIGGIRPLLKREGRGGKGVGVGVGGVMPFVVVGLEGVGGEGGEGKRKLGVEEGKGLALDAGAVGYVAVNYHTGQGMDEGIRQLVTAIQRENSQHPLQQQPQQQDHSHQHGQR